MRELGITGPNLTLLGFARDITLEVIEREWAEIASQGRVRNPAALLATRLATIAGLSLRHANRAKALGNLTHRLSQARRNHGIGP